MDELATKTPAEIVPIDIKEISIDNKLEIIDEGVRKKYLARLSMASLSVCLKDIPSN